MDERGNESEKTRYKEWVIQMVENIENENVLKFVYCILCSFQKKWGV